MSTISPVFTGVSNFANDLQQVIDRAVAIASMPLRQLQNQLEDLNSRSTALSGLGERFSALQTAIADLSGAIGPGGLSGQSSDSAAVSVSVLGALGPDSYTVDVLDAGAYSVSISSAALPAVADPSTTSISASTGYTLTVNGQEFAVSPAGGSLADLAQAINSAGAGVQASLINTGNSGAPNYRLAIRGKTLAADTIQLNDGSQTLLESLNTGRPAQYLVDGLDTPITSASRTVTLAPGVTVDLLKQTLPGEPVTVTVSRDRESLETSVSKLVEAYNAAVSALDEHIGETAGALSGQSLIYTLRKTLSSLTQFTQAGAVSSLMDMGVTLDRYGRLSFNSSRFSSKDPADIQAFLGSAAGGGYLQFVSTALEQVEDPIDGALPAASKLLRQEISRQNALIAENQRRIDDLQTSLQQQMAAADALLAQLETKKTYFNNLFTAMLNYNLNGAGVKAG